MLAVSRFDLPLLFQNEGFATITASCFRYCINGVLGSKQAWLCFSNTCPAFSSFLLHGTPHLAGFRSVEQHRSTCFLHDKLTQLAYSLAMLLQWYPFNFSSGPGSSSHFSSWCVTIGALQRRSSPIIVLRTYQCGSTSLSNTSCKWHNFIALNCFSPLPLDPRLVGKQMNIFLALLISGYDELKVMTP